MRTWLLMLLVGTCSSATSDKDTDAEKLANADLATMVAKEKLAGTWQLGPLYWDTSTRRTVGEARLVFAADPADHLAAPAFVAADQLAVDLGPPPKLLAHADPKKLRAAAARAGDVEVALALARAKLKTLPRYRGWVKAGWAYQTRVWLSAAAIQVVFDTPNVTDQNIDIDIDVVAKKVLKVRLGAA